RRRRPSEARLAGNAQRDGSQAAACGPLSIEAGAVPRGGRRDGQGRLPQLVPLCIGLARVCPRSNGGVKQRGQSRMTGCQNCRRRDAALPTLTSHRKAIELSTNITPTRKTTWVAFLWT